MELQELIEKYHSDLYSKYGDTFKELDKFLHLRNRVTHCSLKWVDRMAGKLYLYDEKVLPNGFQFYGPYEYNSLQIVIDVNNCLNKTAPSLIALQNEVQLRLKESDPQIYTQLVSVLHNDDEGT